MVNSEEGYQNLRRFLFGDLRAKTLLTNFVLDFSANHNSKIPDVTYFLETQAAIRSLPVLMHERTLHHYCAEAIDEQTFNERYRGPDSLLPLFTTFLFMNTREDGTIRFMRKIGLFVQRYEKGFIIFQDHLEQLPLWSDYLIIQLRQPRGESDSSSVLIADYCWASERLEPNTPLRPDPRPDEGTASYTIPLPGTKFQDHLGPEASVRIEVSIWQ
ncbi:MAG: hypothetical protein JOZ62_10785 [Acidobacteriaceae bacterium]|nr:hypothetical protein [Acidobacteriaceae bacterium]